VCKNTQENKAKCGQNYVLKVVLFCLIFLCAFTLSSLIYFNTPQSHFHVPVCSAMWTWLFPEHQQNVWRGGHRLLSAHCGKHHYRNSLPVWRTVFSFAQGVSGAVCW
jgi:hypothetical protein